MTSHKESKGQLADRCPLVGRITPGRLAIEIESERVPVPHDSAKLKLRCAGGNAHSACHGILRLNLESKELIVYRAPYSVPSGASRTLSLRLNPKAYRLISRNSDLFEILQATATVSGGQGASREISLAIPIRFG